MRSDLLIILLIIRGVSRARACEISARRVESGDASEREERGKWDVRRGERRKRRAESECGAIRKEDEEREREKEGKG